jgi:hypothetical protein
MTLVDDTHIGSGQGARSRDSRSRVAPSFALLFHLHAPVFLVTNPFDGAGSMARVACPSRLCPGSAIGSGWGGALLSSIRFQAPPRPFQELRSIHSARCCSWIVTLVDTLRRRPPLRLMTPLLLQIGSGQGGSAPDHCICWCGTALSFFVTHPFDGAASKL